MRPSIVSLFAIVAVSAVTNTAAQESEYAGFDDPFRIYLGGFWASVDSKLSINSDILPPLPPVDVEDVLGVEDSKGVAWGGIAWRISQRNMLEFEYFALKRNGGRSDTYTPPIQVGDTYIEGGSMDTYYDTAISRLTYGFSIIRKERSDLQLKAGLHIADLEAGLQLNGLVCDPTTIPSVPPGCPAASTGVESQDVSAPLPHFGISYAYAISPTLAFNVQAMGFAIEIDDIDGSIIELDADIAWQPWRKFGFGVGVRYFNTDVSAKNADLNGSFEFEYLGPTLYVHATF